MKSYFKFVLATFCIFVWCNKISKAFKVSDFVREVNIEKQCPLIKAVGCYKDNRNHRVMSELLITDRDRYSARYSGKEIDWFNFGVYIKE